MALATCKEIIDKARVGEMERTIEAAVEELDRLLIYGKMNNSIRWTTSAMKMERFQHQ